MFGSDEGVSVCPDCGVDLQQLSRLGPSPETILEREADIENTPREWQVHVWWDLRHGKGVVVVLALVGIVAFFQPWVRMTRPETAILSGYVIARHYAGWIWAGVVGWFVLIPLVVTRRTLVQMRGVRVVAAVLASLTFFEVVMMSTTLGGSQRVQVVFEWEVWFWASGVTSLCGAVAAGLLGLDRAKSQATRSVRPPGHPSRGSAEELPPPGQWLN